jgi:hypothetical protein
MVKESNTKSSTDDSDQYSQYNRYNSYQNRRNNRNWGYRNWENPRPVDPPRYIPREAAAQILSSPHQQQPNALVTTQPDQQRPNQKEDGEGYNRGAYNNRGGERGPYGNQNRFNYRGGYENRDGYNGRRGYRSGYGYRDNYRGGYYNRGNGFYRGGYNNRSSDFNFRNNSPQVPAYYSYNNYNNEYSDLVQVPESVYQTFHETYVTHQGPFNDNPPSNHPSPTFTDPDIPQENENGGHAGLVDRHS